MIGKPLASAELAGKIRALREYGLTLRAIGRRLGIAESSVHKLCQIRTVCLFGDKSPAPSGNRRNHGEQQKRSG
jgi:hypothetical protein